MVAAQSVVWRHPGTQAVLIRCSQPRRGLKMATCHEDERYVECVRQISTAVPSPLNTLTHRPNT